MFYIMLYYVTRQIHLHHLLFGDIKTKGKRIIFAEKKEKNRISKL